MNMEKSVLSFNFTLKLVFEFSNIFNNYFSSSLLISIFLLSSINLLNILSFSSYSKFDNFMSELTSSCSFFLAKLTLYPSAWVWFSLVFIKSFKISLFWFLMLLYKSQAFWSLIETVCRETIDYYEFYRDKDDLFLDLNLLPLFYIIYYKIFSPCYW